MRLKFLVSIALVGICQSATAQWTQTSGPSLGSIPQLFVLGDTVYAALNSGTTGEAVQSTDRGMHWHSISKLLSQNSVVNAVVDDGKALFVATRNGLFISSDIGATWKDAVQSQDVLCMTVSQGIVFYGDNQGGVWRTPDHGLTWMNVSTKLPKSGRITLLFSDGLDLYVCVGGIGIFVSHDLGATWTPSALTLPVNETAGLFMARADSVLFVASAQLVHRSTDGGITWQEADSGIPMGNGASSIAYNGTVCVASNAYGTFRSTDLGVTWKLSKSGLLGSPEVVGTVGNTFIAGALGIFRSSDDGQTWFPSGSGAAASTITSLLNVGGTVLAGNLDNDFGLVWESSDNGDSWISQSKGLSTIGVNALLRTDQTWLSGTDGAGVFYSTDSGATWDTASGLPFDGYVFSIASEGAIALAGTRGFGLSIYRSTDYGKSWSSSHAGLGTNDVESLVSIGGDFLTCLNSDGFFRSKDSGLSWQPVATPPEFDPIILGKHFANLFAAGFKYLYLSKDDGQTWQGDSVGLVGNRVSTMVDANGVLYVGTNHGVFKSLDSGATWAADAAGPIANFQILSMCLTGSTLFCGTNGAGVWKEELVTSTVGNSNRQAVSRLLVNPNPSHETTTIRFELQSRSLVKLEIVDVLGRVTREVENGMESSGPHNVRVELGNLRRGVYFCRLRTAQGTEVTKMEVGD